ncbi:MAG: hypothetical protein JXA18_17075 [Chitinispirillaceae bacterium]|nr:hypothetical protein [Chitinispirillaceae bacterium]
MNRKTVKIVCCLLMLGIVSEVSLFAQESNEVNESVIDEGTPESGQLPAEETAPIETEPAGQLQEPAAQEPPLSGPEIFSGSEGGSQGSEAASTPYTAPPSSLSGSTEESTFQNAIIEGVQLTAEPGAEPDEKIISAYFIFRDKPSSYFYEVKLREKKLIFEFNDTRVGASPVPTASEPPIKGFVIEQGKIDVNKAVKGLKPEWHDLIRVVFDLEAVPDIRVNDEFSIISFSFKWSTDPEKQSKYIVKDQTPKIILWSTAGVGGVALGAVAYLFLHPVSEPERLEKLPVDDLPVHDDNLPFRKH